MKYLFFGLLFLSGCCDSRQPVDLSFYQAKVKVVSIEKERKDTWAGSTMGHFSYKTKHGEIFNDGWVDNSNPKVGDTVCVQQGCMGDCHNLIPCSSMVKK